MQTRYRLNRLFRAAISANYKAYFSQFGEDTVIHRQFPPGFVGTYLDVGAFHPFKWSNTARLWLTGWNGVNVDANRASIHLFDHHRPLDRNIWGAIIPQEGYRKGQTVSFGGSQSKIDPVGRVILTNEIALEPGTAQVPALSLAEVAGYFDQPVDFMNIDIEGLDEVVVVEKAFDKLAPHVLAIEQHGGDIEEILSRKSTQHLLDSGYILTCRCIATSIFRKRIGKL